MAKKAKAKPKAKAKGKSKQQKKNGNRSKKAVAQFKVGLLHSGSKNNTDHDEVKEAFIAGAALAGLNRPEIDLDPKFAEDDHSQLEDLARELIDEDVVLIIAAGGSASAAAARKATATVLNPPAVIFTSVAAPPNPRPNHMTGACALTSGLDSERLRLLTVLMPDATEIAALTNSKRPNFPAEWAALQGAAQQLGVTLKQLDVPSTTSNVPNAVKAKFDTFANPPNIKPLLVTADPLFNNHRKAIVKLANDRKLAAIYQWRQFADDKGLMSYGTKLTQAYRIAGCYAGAILKGGKEPKDLDVVTAKTEMIINKKTAIQEFGGLTIPLALLTQADEVIQ
jgi:putative ABC transport system substrate-binding protein